MRASGIEVDAPSEFENAMEEITERFDSSEKDAKSQSEDKKDKIEKERKQAEEMRNQALERVGETKTRILEDEESREKSHRTRKSRVRHEDASRGGTAKEGYRNCSRQASK